MDPRLGLAARFTALAGLTTGLALAPFGPRTVAAWPLAAIAALVLARMRPAQTPRPAHESLRPTLQAGLWLAGVALAAALCGLAFGGWRLATIDSGALQLAPGEQTTVRGFVAAVPRRSDGIVRVRIESERGRVMVEAPEPVADLDVGDGVEIEGRARAPADWERSYLLRLGVTSVLQAAAIEPTGAERAGLTGTLDRIRDRAQAALGRGTGEAAAALLRGFVLGQDDRIDAATSDDFKRSGLAHLLAVSGQNVILLALLAGGVFVALGVSLRARLAWILVLIALYVPVAGAGASIQRAGVMGAAGVVAALTERARSRWYALLLAAAVTLALNPRTSGDVGWQLSFAAVIGILLAAGPLRQAIGGRREGWRGIAIEGAAVTVAATLATAPLMAFHFGTTSLVTLPANLAALPAVAPVMWLGMLVAALGQLAWFPVEPPTALAGVFAGAIAQVADWFAAPPWALVEARLSGLPVLLATYVALTALVAITLRWQRRRRSLRLTRPAGSARRRRFGLPAATLVLAAVGATLLGGLGGLGGQAAGPASAAGLRIRVLDVGQGDAILLEPPGLAPILVDTGAPGAGAAERLAELGVERLAALVATHPESDHIGAAGEVLERVAAERLVFARIDPATLPLARAAGARPTRVEAGDSWRTGELQIEVLWPPAARLAAVRGGSGRAQPNPNELALVLLCRWRAFEILLAADAEAELAPVDPGEIEVLKLAHHGSEDAGLAGLLERSSPELALVSVGAANPFGHPAPATLTTLADAGVGVARTDLEGEITLDVDKDGWSVR